jgi:hypothetical protein
LTHHATIPDPRHISEIIPWLQRTQFHVYLRGLDPTAFTAMYKVPKMAEANDAALFLVYCSVHRVLRTGLQRLDNGRKQRLFRIDRELLNSF